MTFDLASQTRNVSVTQTLASSAARTDTGTGSAVRIAHAPSGVAFVLDVTAVSTEVGDTLDVFVQTMVDGTNWVDVVAFTQVLGNGGAVRHVGKIAASAALTMFENGTALGAGTVRALIGHQWRARWAVTDAGTDNASFTFSVTACPM